jgi:hypothetical protein
VAPQRSALRRQSMAESPPPSTATRRPGHLDAGAVDGVGGDVGLDEEGQSLVDVAEVGAGDVERLGLRGAHGQEHGVEVAQQPGEVEVGAEAHPEPELDAALLDPADAARDEGLLELERGDAVDQQAAGHRLRLEHRDPVAELASWSAQVRPPGPEPMTATRNPLGRPAPGASRRGRSRIR